MRRKIKAAHWEIDEVGDSTLKSKEQIIKDMEKRLKLFNTRLTVNYRLLVPQLAKVSLMVKKDGFFSVAFKGLLENIDCLDIL